MQNNIQSFGQDSGQGSGHSFLRAMPAALSFIIFIFLYYLREFDDNRLVPWGQVFSFIDASGVMVAMALGGLVALMLSNLRLPGPRGLFVLSAGVGLCFLSIPEVIVDSSRYFLQAKHLSEYGAGYYLSQWGGAIETWTDLPLVPFIYGIGFRLFGEHRIVAQLTVLLMFSGTVALLSLLGQELFSDRAGRIAGIYLLSIPYIYTQTPLMMVDVPAMFFLVLALYMFYGALSRGGFYAALWAPLSLFMACLSKYSIWAMLSVCIPVFVIMAVESPARTFRRAALCTFIFALLAGPVLYYYRDIIGGQMDLLFSYQKPGLRRWGESYLSTFFFQVHPFVTLSALFSIFVAIKKRASRYAIALWLPVLIVLVLDVKRIRYSIPVFPMLALMGAYAISHIRSDSHVRGIAWTALVSSLVLALVAYMPFLTNNSLVNLKHAGSYIDFACPGPVHVRTMPQRSIINPAVSVPLLDMYTDAPICYESDMLPLKSDEEIERSPFRFTWTYSDPDFYGKADVCVQEGSGAYAVISPDEPVQNNSESYPFKSLGKFEVQDGMYRFRPLVYVYCNSN